MPSLLAAYDIEARGPLATIVSSRGIVGAGRGRFAPRTGQLAGSGPLADHGEAAREPWPCDSNAELVAGNAMATCLPFFEALARTERRTVCVGLSPTLLLELDIDFPACRTRR